MADADAIERVRKIVRRHVGAVGNPYIDISLFDLRALLSAYDRLSEREDRLDAAEAEVARLREALQPFSDMGGEMFARNRNASDVTTALDNPGEPHRITVGDFFRAHAALPRAPAPEPLYTLTKAEHDALQQAAIASGKVVGSVYGLRSWRPNSNLGWKDR